MVNAEWLANIKVRTQISAFLAGAFFAVLSVLVTQQDTQTALDLHRIITLVSLTVTFAPLLSQLLLLA